FVDTIESWNFDVLVEWNRLSKGKLGTVWVHEKVLGYRWKGESKLSDIFIVRDFIDVFPEDLSMTTTTTSGVPHRFGSGRRHFAKSPYRLTPLEMRELSEQLRELQDKATGYDIQYGVRGMILAAQSEGDQQENVLAERLHWCMMAIFHDMIEKTMEVFMDDFSVFGNSFGTCLSHLDKMLKRCEDTNLCLNWEKSHFMVKEGIVLGHKISKNGIEVDKAKVDVIAKLPHPTTVKGI
ncbi:hypothetical protein Tco_1054639, partial [Tanacetum coccineum]